MEGHDEHGREQEEHTLELREEQLTANTAAHEVGEVIIRKEIDSQPAQLEVDAWREEVEVIHEPVGQSVSRRQEPWEEDDELVVPIYEEQLVVTRRLILRERLRVRRIRVTERQLFQESVKRERLVVEDPQQTGRVHEINPAESLDNEHATEDEAMNGTFLTRLGKKVLE